MKNTFVLWKEIIANPFEGYKGVNDNTGILLPVLSIILLFIISVSMMLPILVSEPYADAVVRTQISAMAERGNEMSLEQQTAMAEQMSSPMFRNITIASSYGGGLIGLIVITLLVTLILKLIVSSVKKEKVKFSLVFKIIIFALIVGMVQSIVKMGITLAGDWPRILARVNDAAGLQQALQSPVSLAALFDRATVGNTVYTLINSLTDVFNWIYYLFIYAGLRSALVIEKKPALIVTVVIALISIAVEVIFTLFI